jgi:D-xylose transport system substrate-binding protein
MKPLRILCLLFITASLLLFSSCKTPTPKIGILLHSYENERWNKDKEYLVNDLTQLGAQVFLEIADNNQDKQIEQAKKLISEGVQVLVVVPINQDKAAEIVELAHNANVKVIGYDRLINNCKLDYYITSNSYRIGELQTTYLTSLKPDGKYALIPGSKYDDNSMKLFLGQMNILQPFIETGAIQLIYSEFTDDWSAEQGKIHAKKILEENPDQITAIVAGNDAIADGVLEVLKEQGREGEIMVAGQDAELDNIKAIMSGDQTCSVLKPLREMAKKTSELAVDLALGKPVHLKFTSESNGKALVKSILIDAIVVNKNNIESTIVSSGYHTSAELSR